MARSEDGGAEAPGTANPGTANPGTENPGTEKAGTADGGTAVQARPPGRPEGSMRPAFVGLLGSMAALGAVTVDMYLPSLPTVAAEFGTSDAAVQLTISAVLVGAALGQLLIGPMSDRFGRRGPALAGIGLHVVASVLCVFAPTVNVLIALRVVQGVGNSAAMITAMAVIRDRLTGGRAARVISRLMLVIGVAPLVAPTVGGLIAGVAGWRAVFGALALLGVALGVVVWRWLPETLPRQRRTTAGALAALRDYRSLLTDRHFIALAIMPGLVMGALFSYVAGSPFVLQIGYGLSEQQFALLFALNGIGLVMGSQVNASLVHRVAPIRIVRIAMPLLLATALVLLAIAATGVGGVLGILAPLWVILFLLGFLIGNAAAMALSLRGERAGTAAAVIGASQSGVAALVSPLGGDAFAMALSITISLLAAMLVLAIATPAYRSDLGGMGHHG